MTAEIPNKETQPELYKLVKKYMVHGPCVGFNTKSPCLDGQKTHCDKNYPMKYQEHTTSTETGFITYRRRSVEQGGHTMDIKISGHDKPITLDNKV